MNQAKWALVTGASSGIGKAISQKLAAEGYNLFLMARNQEKLTQVQSELLRVNSKLQVKVIAIDLLNTSEIEQQVKLILSQFPKDQGIDVVINNAGLALGVSKFQEGNLQDWEIMFNTNVRALLTLTRLILPSMIARKTGHVVNIGSVAGRWVYPNGAIYCATKHAVRAITEGMRMDLLGTGVRVTEIEPGMVETNFSVVRLKDENRAKAVYQGMTPLLAGDIAESIFWCLSRPSHVNIQELVIYPTDQASVRDVYRGE